ncbi:hypothetical protein [Alcanivorax sp.]|uniref:hypothetical protein n=1 Tax=Alcanivorax sp. TaxID=1872427 RepID=UPI0025BB7DD2|nr:hypothetical protein [Alcanivorax sp.]
MNTITPYLLLCVLTCCSILTGCKSAKTLYNGVACGAGAICTEAYPLESLSDTRSAEKIVIAPPFFELEIRDRDGDYHPFPTMLERIPPDTIQYYQKHADAYEISLSMPSAGLSGHLDEFQNLYFDTFIDFAPIDRPSPSVKGFLQAMATGPERQNPVKTDAIRLDGNRAAERLDVNEACCILLTRVRGWHESRESYNASVTSAIIFSSLAGSSGAASYAGEVVVDMAVIRLEDGKLIWSSQTTGPVSGLAIRRGITPYYSAVANLRLGSSDK